MSDVLVDSSIWIEFFRRPHSPYTQTLDLLLAEERVCTTSIVKAEILPGARSQQEFGRLRGYFDALPAVDPPSTIWDDLISYQMQLRAHRVAWTSIPDLIVAIVAMAHQKILFTRDRHFLEMQRLLPLRLLQI